jgi:hypothetical protein
MKVHSVEIKYSLEGEDSPDQVIRVGPCELTFAVNFQIRQDPDGVYLQTGNKNVTVKAIQFEEE